MRHVVKARLRALTGVTPDTVRASRQRLDALARRVRAPAGVAVHTAPPGCGGGEWLWPGPAATRHGLYLHGGAYAVGTARLYRGLAGRLATGTGCTVLVPDYPLAPEHAFPAALEGALAGWRALRSATGVPPSWIAGDSAGGGLALALAQRLRDLGEPAAAGLALLSPWTDLTGSGASVGDNAERDQYLCAHLVGPVAAVYLQGADPTDPRASPLFGPMQALPPTLVHVCESEILRDDGVRAAARLDAADVPVALRRFGDLPHVFHLFAPLLPEATRAVADVADFLARHAAA